MTYCINLKDLNLSKSEIGSRFKIFMEGLKTNRAITKLDFSCETFCLLTTLTLLKSCKIGNERLTDVEELLKKTATLTELNLSGT